MEKNYHSILEESTELNQENLEYCIACGSSKKDLFTIFGKTSGEMDSWSMENYNLHFDEVYAKVARIVRNRFLEKVDCLSERGNSTALSIMANFLLNFNENNKQDSGITIINNIPMKEDKKDDRSGK